MDYSEFLPDIDVADGKKRVMGNMQLYHRLVGNFDGEKMAAAIADAIEAGDTKATAQAAHALRGTAANLGFPLVLKAAEDIEQNAKDGKDCTALVPPLKEAVGSLAVAVSRLTPPKE